MKMPGLSTEVLSITLLAMVICAGQTAFAGPPIPANWGDIRIGLVNDNNAKINARMKQAVKEGVQLTYRYRYVNGGFDSTSNSMSWMFTQYTDYVKQSDSLAGVQASFVIYMLQEEGGSAVTIANVKNRENMRKYFANIRSVATRCKGRQSVFIIEPDTWGYLMQNGYMDPAAITATITDLGSEFDYLQGLPNNLCGIAQGVIRTIHRFAPDAYAGVLASHWSVIGTGWNVNGLAWSSDAMINESIAKNAAWFNTLLGSGPDRGDFIGIEKNGWSAGRWKKFDGRTSWYWGDDQNKNYLRWCKGVVDGLNLPAVGWQISIGHMGLPNVTVETYTDNAYEDTYFPYFFTHVKDFVDAGFIGFLVGKGIADDTDFSNETEGAVGDRGWFFSNLKAFDKGRPYLPSMPVKQGKTAHYKDKHCIKIQNGGIHLYGSFAHKNRLGVDLFSINGKRVACLYDDFFDGNSMVIPIHNKLISPGRYVIRMDYCGINESAGLFIGR